MELAAGLEVEVVEVVVLAASENSAEPPVLR